MHPHHEKQTVIVFLKGLLDAVIADVGNFFFAVRYKFFFTASGCGANKRPKSPFNIWSEDHDTLREKKVRARNFEVLARNNGLVGVWYLHTTDTARRKCKGCADGMRL